MNDVQDYIEAYFAGRLNESEKMQFEDRCIRDEAFARQVASYITTSEGIRLVLLQQKKQQWAGDEPGGKNSATIPRKKRTLRYWMPYAAAACIILAIIITYFLSRPESPQERADKYITQHFALLSPTMNSSKDSLQRGIAAYNNKDYRTALQMFEAIYTSNPSHGTAKEYIGIVHLVTKDYNKAIRHFDELAAKQGLYKNHGLFLKAVTLLKRNKPGDQTEAKQVLERVVNEEAEGSKVAKKWLEKW